MKLASVRLLAATLVAGASAVCAFAPMASMARSPPVSSSSPARAITGLYMASTEVIPPDFKLPGAIVALGVGISLAGAPGNGLPLAAVGGLLAVQATRVRFEFDQEAMEVKIQGQGGDLVDSGDNFAVGGQNRWRYDTWTNWEVYPSESFPVLMYFKETQTSPEGQIHFFPFIMQPEKLLREVRARVPLAK